MSIQRIIGKSAVASFAAAFAVVGSGLGAQTAQGWQPTEDDSLLLQVRVGRYMFEGDARGYRTDRGVCVDLGDVIQVLDLPVRLDKKSRRATGWLFAEEQTITIDRDSNTVQIVNTTQNLTPGEIYDTPEGWCVDDKTLSRWFGLDLKADPFNQVMMIDGDPSLPFLQALERRLRAARLRPSKQEFDLAALPQADMPYEAWRAPSVDMTVNFDFDKTPGGKSNAYLRYELFASGEVAGASYDARFASNSSGGPGSLRMRVFRFDPEGGLLGPLEATQVAIGDVETGTGGLAGRNGYGRGAMISNKPIIRASSFSKTTIRGAMPAGWDAELYRNGQLIAFQGGSSDGRYDFLDIDLLFGNNDFEVVLYGPQGQIRRETSSIPVGMESIEPGKTYYWAAVIEQGKDLLNFDREIVDPLTGWRWGVGVERGIDDRTMAAITAQSMMIEGRRRDFAELNLRRALGPMLVELSVAQSFGRGRAYQAQGLGKIGKVNFEFQTLWIDGGFESDIVDRRVRNETSFGVDTSLKLGRISLPLEAEFRREGLRDGSIVNEWLIQASIARSGLSLTAALHHLWVENAALSTTAEEAGYKLNLLANARLGAVSLRGETRFRLSGVNKGFESVKLVGELPLTERSALRGEVEHNMLGGRTDFRLGYTREFKRFALEAQGGVGSDGSVRFGLGLAMSMGPNPAGGGVRFSHERLARSGQTAVTVYRDDDGDGRRSPGEGPIEGVAVEAGFASSEHVTDADGVTIIEGMRPYEPILVTIDTGSLPDPYLQPVGKGIVVTPRPGVLAEIELPLAPTGEIEGTIHGLAGTPRGGVELELVDGLGQVVATTRSEFDGFFLFEAVPYGRYTLRISEESASALGAERTIAGTVEISGGNEVGRLGIVKLKSSDVAATDEAIDPAAPPSARP
jgi:hypothetical protein